MTRRLFDDRAERVDTAVRPAAGVAAAVMKRAGDEVDPSTRPPFERSFAARAIGPALLPVFTSSPWRRALRSTLERGVPRPAGSLAKRRIPHPVASTLTTAGVCGFVEGHDEDLPPPPSRPREASLALAVTSGLSGGGSATRFFGRREAASAAKRPKPRGGPGRRSAASLQFGIELDAR